MDTFDSPQSYVMATYLKWLGSGWQHMTKLWPTIKISIQVSWLLEAGGVKLACLVILLSFKVRLGSFIEAAIVDLTEIQCPTQRLK